MVFLCEYKHQLTLESDTAGSARVRHTLRGDDANNESPVNTSNTLLLFISRIHTHLQIWSRANVAHQQDTASSETAFHFYPLVVRERFVLTNQNSYFNDPTLILKILG